MQDQILLFILNLRHSTIAVLEEISRKECRKTPFLYYRLSYSNIIKLFFVAFWNFENEPTKGNKL